MQYRHAFHAGNFADVHKHIALLQLLASLRRKAKGFLYLDTHAGEGAYDLDGFDATQGGESDAGITRLLLALAQSATPAHAALLEYAERVVRLRQACHEPHLYPGSPLLALGSLRDVDGAVLVESQAPVARALQRALERHAPTSASATRVVQRDGYRELRAHLPPAVRRGLVLIDPPYETRMEEEHIATALQAGLERFETGVYAVWYPIKRRSDSDAWLARVTSGITRPTLTAEFCLHPPDHTAGLNGSGMLVVNPPFEFDTGAQAWQAQLEPLLGASGGSRVHWLVREGR